MKIKLLTVIKIFSLLFLIGFTFFAISIPISASFLSIKPPSINNVKITFVNDTLIANASFTITNNGFYDLQELTINVALYTLNHLLITSSQIGFPKEQITVKAYSTYTGNISIKFNINELSDLNIINELKKDKAVYIEVSASGRYGFGMFSFNALYSGKFSFSLPIEDIRLNFYETPSISLENIYSNKDYVIAKLNAILDYNGTISFNQTKISGYALSNNTEIFSFNSSIERISPGRNTIQLNLYIPKEQVTKLLFNDLTLKIFYTVSSNIFNIKNSINYEWKKPFYVSLRSFQLDTNGSNNIILKTYLDLNSYLNSNLNFSTQLKIYDNSLNKLINVTNMNFMIKPYSSNEIYLEILLNNVYHGMILRIELYITGPLQMDTPVVIKFFILP